MMIEIAVFSLEAACAAQAAGADRIELCCAPAEGGLTPSAATMRLARKHLSIPIHVMIRPREGDFCYTDGEFESMLLDIFAASVSGADGIVAGILLKDGRVDATRMKILMEAAGKMSVTFHRAFDRANNQEEALETLINLGVARVLTSGGRQTAINGISQIKRLVDRADGRIIIMPGSGINDTNVRELVSKTEVKEIHLSARLLQPGMMEYRNPEFNIATRADVPEYDLIMPDSRMIQNIRKQLN